MIKPTLSDTPVLRLNIPCYDAALIKPMLNSGYANYKHPFEIDEALSNPEKGIVHIFSRWKGETAPKAEHLAYRYSSALNGVGWRDKIFPRIPPNIADLPQRGTIWRTDKNKTQTLYEDAKGILLLGSYDELLLKIEYILEKMGAYYDMHPDIYAWAHVWEDYQGDDAEFQYTYVQFKIDVPHDIAFEFMYRYMRFEGDKYNVEGFSV